MQKAASSQGTSGRTARSGGDALAPPACSSSSPPPLPPPPPPITPPASAASTAGAGPGAGAGAPTAAAKRPKSPDPQRASWAQAAANCARLHHIAMWRHRWLGYGWGETATSAARVKKSEKKRRHNDEIMKEVLRHIAKNESIAVKLQRNNLKSVRPSTQHCNRSSTSTAPQRLRNAGHARPRNHPPIRGDKLMSAIRRQRIRKNSARPQTQRRSRVEKKSPTTQRQGSSSDAQTGKQTKHESRKERASQSLQQIRCSSNTGSTQRRRRRSRDSFQSQRDNGISSSSQRRHRSSDHSLVMSQPRGRSCDKRSCSQTSGDESLSPDRRETSTSPGRKCASTSVSPQRRCKKETATKQTKKRSDEKSPTVTQPGRRGRDDDPNTMIPTRRKRSDSVERLSQPIRRNHMEITHSAPHLPSSHTTSIPKRSRRGISNEASESSERIFRSRSCTRALSDSRLQDRSPDRRPSEGWVRDLKTNIVSTFDQPNNYYCNKTLMKYFADATLPGNVEKAQPWEYRNGSRFRSSWWRHRRPYLVSTTTQTTRRSRHNPNGGNMSSRSRRSEVSSGSPHRRVNIAARTSQFRERSHERPSMPEPYSRGVTAQARTSQTQARHYNWTNIPPSPRDHSPAGLESHPRRKRHGNSSSSTKHNTTEESMRQNRRNCVTPSPPHPRLLHHESILAEAQHGSNIISRATQTKSQRFGRSSRTHLRCRDAAVMTTQPKLWRLDTGTAMRPPAMKEDASSSASLPSAVDLSLSIFLQILRQPLVAAAAAAAVAAAAGANGPIPPSEPQPSAAVGAGDSATPTPCKPPEE